MAELPRASTTVEAQAGGFAAGTGYLVVLAAVALAADSKPRVYSRTQAIIDKHGYNQGASYVGSHIQKTGKPVLFCGLPIATPATVGQYDSTGVTGTCRIQVTAGANGYLDECDGYVEVDTGGTVGTPGIVLLISMDGGRTKKRHRLGTAASYTVPHVGVILSFGTGTLVAGDVFLFRTTAPLWDATGLQTARAELAAQLKLARTWMVIGDAPTEDAASDVLEQVNAYETENQRFTRARVAVRDYNPNYAPRMSRVKSAMSGSPTLTFAEVGATGDTITRSAGSWIDDGFAVGDIITVAGSVSNNVTGPIASLSATVITLDTTDLVAEGPVADCTVLGSASLTFAEVGVTDDTITRSAGSWIADGFKVGDIVTVAGTASNNVTGPIKALSATVLTFDATDLAAEVIGSRLVTITKTQTLDDWLSESDEDFDGIDAQPRITLSIGRGRRQCPVTGWRFRRSAGWHASVREYEQRLDIHMPNWAKDDGPLDGVTIEDDEDNIEEVDARSNEAALAGRFECLRTWGNGPNGAFVALGLTRDTEDSILSLSHNEDVTNYACTIVQAETEMLVGKILVVTKAGKAEPASLSVMEKRVNKKLQKELLVARKGLPPRASGAVWSASRDDDFSVPNAELTGETELIVNGTIVRVATKVRVGAPATG